MEQVSKEMMEELNECIEKTLPSFLGEIINNTNEVVKTPKIREWYVNESNRELLNSKSISVWEEFDKTLQIKLFKHCYLGQPQFEEEKPKRWIVKSKVRDREGHIWYLSKRSIRADGVFPKYTTVDGGKRLFDTKEEADEWNTPQTEVVEVDE